MINENDVVFSARLVSVGESEALGEGAMAVFQRDTDDDATRLVHITGLTVGEARSLATLMFATLDVGLAVTAATDDPP